MKKEYQIVGRKDSRKLAELLSKDAQLLLPMLELIETAEFAVDELMDVAGRATIEAVLLMSAQEVAVIKHPGKKSGEADLGPDIGQKRIRILLNECANSS